MASTTKTVQVKIEKEIIQKSLFISIELELNLTDTGYDGLTLFCFNYVFHPCRAVYIRFSFSGPRLPAPRKQALGRGS